MMNLAMRRMAGVRAMSKCFRGDDGVSAGGSYAYSILARQSTAGSAFIPIAASPRGNATSQYAGASCAAHSSWSVSLRPLSASVARSNVSTSAAPPAFPCVDAHEARTARLLASQGPMIDERDAGAQLLGQTTEGPEPAYYKIVSGYQVYHHPTPLSLDYGGELPEFDIAYETWGTLNKDKSNAILVHTGLSASSHAASHAANPAKGWWEDFIGPGKPLDTNRFFVVCTNVIGGCYGSTGPSSPHPLDPDRKPYATRFPIISIFDMVRAQFHLLDHLQISTLYASIGSSMGGMQSVAAVHLFPERVQRLVSISGCARSAPASIALRYAQRSVLMSDPNWNRGFYYDTMPPHTGMKLARQIATITYRSGPEWEQRFGRQRRQLADEHGTLKTADPALCPDFLIETYLDHQGEQFCLKYDANSLIYVSKAMDLFDMSQEALDDLERRRRQQQQQQLKEDGVTAEGIAQTDDLVSDTTASSAVADVVPSSSTSVQQARKRQYIQTLASPSAHTYLPSLARGLQRLSSHPTLVLGAQSDILFPIDQQRELAECLRRNGNTQVRYYEIDAPHGHDSFLIDVANVGGAIKGFLD